MSSYEERMRAVGNPPLLTVGRDRNYAAMASRCFGVNPPSAMFGRRDCSLIATGLQNPGPRKLCRTDIAQAIRSARW